jgi:hypothetical protein
MNLKFKIFLGLILFFGVFCFAKNSFAAPSILGVSGTVSQGQSITISGSGFGTNTAAGTSAQESLASAILSGTNGSEFTRANWEIDTEFSGDVTYTNSNTRGGTRTKALVAQSTNSYPETPLYYIFPSAVTSSDHLFISWWEKVTWVGNGQYKALRLSPTETITDGDGQDCWFFHNNGTGAYWTQPYYTNSLWPDFSPGEPQNVWQRFDVDISTSGSANGSVNFTNYVPGSAVQTNLNSNYQTHRSGLNWNYLVWQNYFGTDGAGAMTAGTVWLDSIFIQHGTSARVELCDSSTWANRETCEIQPSSSWGSSSIGTTISQGTFNNGVTAYLYVLDSSGAVNANGYSVTLGSGSSDTTIPSAPTGISVQ